MRTVAFLALLLLALPGCAGGDGDGEETMSSTATTSAATNTTTAPPPVNTPPEANLTADIDNGTAPLAVNFTLDAMDADGDVLNWTFDADGDGTFEANGTSADLPLVVAFIFNVTGQFRAAFNVSDGNASLQAIHLVVVAEGSGADALVDYGEYVYDPATGLCHAKDYTEEAPGVYVSTIGGGNWVFLEDNDVAGLQYENNHPLRDVPAAGFQLPVEPICVGGDQTAV